MFFLYKCTYNIIYTRGLDFKFGMIQLQSNFLIIKFIYDLKPVALQLVSSRNVSQLNNNI